MSIYPPVRATMIRLLSTPRLDTYTSACGGSVPEALELYRWNLDVSMAYFEIIHYFEVAFRNTLDAALSKWFLNTYSGAAAGVNQSWFDTDNVLLPQSKTPAQLLGLNSNSIGLIRTATRNAGQRHAPVLHGHVVAELTLGFWQNLIKPPGEGTPKQQQKLWGSVLKGAFVPGVKQLKLNDSVEQIRALRNRIAHHEPIFALNLHQEYENIIRTGEVVATGLGWWIDSVSRVESVLTQRP